MPVDKAWKECLERNYTDDELDFFKKHKNQSAAYFYSGYEAGQKSLSPEVQDLLDIILEAIKTGDIDIINRCKMPIENLLAKE